MMCRVMCDKKSLCVLCNSYLDFDCKFNFDVHEIITTEMNPKTTQRDPKITSNGAGKMRICPKTLRDYMELWMFYCYDFCLITFSFIRNIFFWWLFVFEMISMTLWNSSQIGGLYLCRAIWLTRGITHCHRHVVIIIGVIVFFRLKFNMIQFWVWMMNRW